MRNVCGRDYAALMIDETEIAAIMQRFPMLSAYGFGLFGQYHPEYRIDTSVELQQCRDQLLAEVEECSNACKWLSRVGKAKRINERHSSYGLKHYVERFYPGSGCTNGAFIAAAIHLGFEWVQRGSAAYFNFDQTSLERQMVTIN